MSMTPAKKAAVWLAVFALALPFFLFGVAVITLKVTQ